MNNSFLFFQDLPEFTIYQRNHFSSVFIITKSRKIKQYMDPDFFYEIINSPVTDPDLIFAFPWVLEIDDLFKQKYIFEYKKHWNITKG